MLSDCVREIWTWHPLCWVTDSWQALEENSPCLCNSLHKEWISRAGTWVMVQEWFHLAAVSWTGSFSSLGAERAEAELQGVFALFFLNFFFPFLKSLPQSLPVMPNLRSHFQILPDTVETFLARWRQDKHKGEGNCSVLQLSAEERELCGFEPGQNDWFFTSDDDWRIGTVLRDVLGVSGAVVIYLNDEFKAAVLWNGLLCKLVLNSAPYFNNDLWNSHSEILSCVVK